MLFSPTARLPANFGSLLASPDFHCSFFSEPPALAASAATPAHRPAAALAASQASDPLAAAAAGSFPAAFPTFPGFGAPGSLGATALGSSAALRSSGGGAVPPPPAAFQPTPLAQLPTPSLSFGWLGLQAPRGPGGWVALCRGWKQRRRRRQGAAAGDSLARARLKLPNPPSLAPLQAPPSPLACPCPPRQPGPRPSPPPPPLPAHLRRTAARSRPSAIRAAASGPATALQPLPPRMASSLIPRP